MTFLNMQNSVRNMLRAYGQTRFIDAEIKSEINIGYNEFVNLSHCLWKQDTLDIVEGTATYTLPTDLLFLYRSEWDGKKLEPYTVEQMDRLKGNDWRTTTSTSIQAIIMDHEDTGVLRVFPILSDSDYNDELSIDYVYSPTDMSSDSDTPDFSAAYHLGLVYYAVSILQMKEVQSDQRPAISQQFHHRQFMKYVNRAKVATVTGVHINRRPQLILRPFV